MIHSDAVVLPQYTQIFFNDIEAKDKKLYWMETDLESPYHQFSYYDQDTEVDESIKEVSNRFNLKRYLLNSDILKDVL